MFPGQHLSFFVPKTQEVASSYYSGPFTTNHNCPRVFINPSNFTQLETLVEGWASLRHSLS
jgi:hypothetical protein